LRLCRDFGAVHAADVHDVIPAGQRYFLQEPMMAGLAGAY
jgi:hypothetical protein